MKLIELIEQYNAALQSIDYDAISEIISHLNAVPDPQKKEFLNFYKQIEDDLFERNRTSPNLNFSRFEKLIKDWDEKNNSTDKQPDKPKDMQPEDKVDGFDMHFTTFYNRHKGLFLKLKDYYLFRLSVSDTSSKPGLLILCDKESVNRPELEKISVNETILPVSKSTIQDFSISFKKSPLKDFNFICILSITPSLKESDTLSTDLKELFGLFDKSETLSIFKDKEGSLIEFKYEGIDGTGLDELIESTNKLFNNTKLTYEEQRLIKKFIGSAPAVIDYTVLKPGASGSGVIEVQANFLLTKDSKRYVIKISRKEKGKPSKLKAELKNFKDYISHFGSAAYSADYEEIETYEAIKYNYASANSINASTSFYDLIERYLADKEDVANELCKIITNLFSDPIMNSWNTPVQHTQKISDLYPAYIKNEIKIVEAIAEIKNKPKEEIIQSHLFKFYTSLKEHNLETFKKCCHGDLHSENLFWDSSNVILIDFGFTGRHHAIVDHAFLEISIRLRHFPKYIQISELMTYEEVFLGTESFEDDMDLSLIERPKLKDLFRLINLIRIDAKKYCYNKLDVRKEYLISLFIISFRLCQYKDLNQAYALQIAESLSKRIAFS